MRKDDALDLDEVIIATGPLHPVEAADRGDIGPAGGKIAAQPVVAKAEAMEHERAIGTAISVHPIMESAVVKTVELRRQPPLDRIGNLFGRLPWRSMNLERHAAEIDFCMPVAAATAAHQPGRTLGVMNHAGTRKCHDLRPKLPDQIGPTRSNGSTGCPRASNRRTAPAKADHVFHAAPGIRSSERDAGFETRPYAPHIIDDDLRASLYAIKKGGHQRLAGGEHLTRHGDDLARKLYDRNQRLADEFTCGDTKPRPSAAKLVNRAEQAGNLLPKPGETVDDRLYRRHDWLNRPHGL